MDGPPRHIMPATPIRRDFQAGYKMMARIGWRHGSDGPRSQAVIDTPGLDVFASADKRHLAAAEKAELRVLTGRWL